MQSNNKFRWKKLKNIVSVWRVSRTTAVCYISDDSFFASQSFCSIFALCRFFALVQWIPRTKSWWAEKEQTRNSIFWQCWRSTTTAACTGNVFIYKKNTYRLSLCALFSSQPHSCTRTDTRIRLFFFNFFAISPKWKIIASSMTFWCIQLIFSTSLFWFAGARRMCLAKRWIRLIHCRTAQNIAYTASTQMLVYGHYTTTPSHRLTWRNVSRRYTRQRLHIHNGNENRYILDTKQPHYMKWKEHRVEFRSTPMPHLSLRKEYFLRSMRR